MKFLFFFIITFFVILLFNSLKIKPSLTKEELSILPILCEQKEIKLIKCQDSIFKSCQLIFTDGSKGYIKKEQYQKESYREGLVLENCFQEKKTHRFYTKNEWHPY